MRLVKFASDGRLIKQSNGLEFIYDANGLAGFKYDNKMYFYRRDVQGNIIAILNSKGEVVANYIYDVWGESLIKDSAGNKKYDYNNTDQTFIGVINPFRYRGYYYDKETGLYYLQSRYYDPLSGRFISPDSIEYADPETINGLNLYVYCGNNPVMNVDPTGEFALTAFALTLLLGIGFGAVLGGTVSGVQAYNEGRRGWELFASIAGGAMVGGAMGAVMVLGGAAGFVYSTGAVVTGFGLTTIQALSASAVIGAAANLSAYLLVNGVHSDKTITLSGAVKSVGSGATQASITFGIGFIGGKNGLFKNLGNYNTWDGFYVNIVNTTGKLSLLTRFFNAVSMLFGDTITKAVYLSGTAAIFRYFTDLLFKKLPN